MHPVNTEGFGANGMTITYNLGAGPTSGTIIKQIGLTRYVVDTGAIVRLAKTSAEVSSLPVGVGTIAVTPVGGGTQHARKIFYRKLVTVEGHTYKWRKTTADQPGECNVAGNWVTGADRSGYSHKVNV